MRIRILAWSYSVSSQTAYYYKGELKISNYTVEKLDNILTGRSKLSSPVRDRWLSYTSRWDTLKRK